MERTVRASGCAAALVAAFLGSGGGVWAAETQDHVRTELLIENETIQPGVPFWAAVRLEMDPGWHTYWTNPGDSGLPTRVRWTLPPGFEAGPLQWPYPEKFLLGTLINYGYAGECVLLTRVTPPKYLKEKTVVLEAHVSWVECADFCVPGKATLARSVAVTGGPPDLDSRWTKLFDRTRRLLPREGYHWKTTAIRRDDGIQLIVVPAGRNREEWIDPEFFPEGDPPRAGMAVKRARMGRSGVEIDLASADEDRGFSGPLKGILVISKKDKSRQAFVIEAKLE